VLGESLVRVAIAMEGDSVGLSEAAGSVVDEFEFVSAGIDSGCSINLIVSSRQRVHQLFEVSGRVGHELAVRV
jgi:hypothetical protein